MKITLASVVALLVVEFSGALPVVKPSEEPKETEKGGDIAREGVPMTPHKFDPYDPNTRTAWEEENRRKLRLLEHYYEREKELESDMDMNPFKHHKDGDAAQLHAAEIAEVKNSIRKLTIELAQMDHDRRELFKQYEMEKAFKEQQREKAMDEEKRKQYHAQQEKLREQQKKHEPLHHPGSKQQLEEVWEKQDHAEQDFDPEVFFNLHDTDSNGVWDHDEVKSLFKTELDKLSPGDPAKMDTRERREEMERMREHFFKVADTDRNELIDYHEFLKQTEDPNFQKDEGWEDVNGQQIYTQEEYENYLREDERWRQQAAQANMNAAGNGMPPHPNAGNYYQVPPQQQQYGDPNLAYHQGQMPHPAQYQNQMPPQQQQYQGHQQMTGQQPPQYQQVPVPQQHYQVPQNAPHAQIPHEQQYQDQVVQQTQQQQQHQQQQQQQQQQHLNVPVHNNGQPQHQENLQPQHNSDQVNGKVQPAVQNVQHQAAVQQQPPPQQNSPNGAQSVETNAAPAVVSKDNV